MAEWIYKDDELPSAYEEVEVMLTDGTICNEMIIRDEIDGFLLWSNHDDSDIVSWRRTE